MTQQTQPPRPRRATLAELREEAIRDHHAGALDKARAKYRLYLARAPEDAAIWTNLGALHRSQKDYPAAVACQRKAVELKPDGIDFLNNLGNALFDNGELDEALELRLRVAAAQPDRATPLQYVATSLRALNRNAEAIEVCERGLALEPDHNELKLQRALAELALGDYPRGFVSFEARWQGDEISKPEFPEPEWDGSDPAGRTLLVMPEQGFGDTVLMARFLPWLKARGARVLLACKTPLMRLFDGLEGVDGLLEIGSRKPPIDGWVSMMSLPRHLGLSMENLPPPARLTVPEDSRERAKMILAPFARRLKVGVLWSGSVTYRANHKRSFSQDMFYRLAAIPGLQLFSLYKGPLHSEFQSSGLASVVIDASGSDRDFADTAALIEGLDLVVSMDSAVVHVAGSLGAPVWNLLHFSAYWLYGPFPDHTPWYPSMRLIRQPAPDDWDSVFDRVAAELGEMAGRTAG
ncbi:MAG: tetratricopeptide repeat protein [Alphaproteobacteria bacterium]|nr:MAG: tetratricopeptide repeat protein [Alphaproteobacteria bacterium]